MADVDVVAAQSSYRPGQVSNERQGLVLNEPSNVRLQGTHWRKTSVQRLSTQTNVRISQRAL